MMLASFSRVESGIFSVKLAPAFATAAKQFMFGGTRGSSACAAAVEPLIERERSKAVCGRMAGAVTKSTLEIGEAAAGACHVMASCGVASTGMTAAFQGVVADRAPLSTQVAYSTTRQPLPARMVSPLMFSSVTSVSLDEDAAVDTETGCVLMSNPFTAAGGDRAGEQKDAVLFTYKAQVAASLETTRSVTGEDETFRRGVSMLLVGSTGMMEKEDAVHSADKVVGYKISKLLETEPATLTRDRARRG